MPISDELIGKNATERAAIKAGRIHALVDAAIAAAAAKNKQYTFTLRDGRKVTVEAVRLGILKRDSTGVIVFEPRTDGGADPVWFRVSLDGRYPNGDGWYGFVNPPILVPDGTFTDGRPNFKEDLIAAAQTILAQALGGEI